MALRYGVGPVWNARRPLWLRRFAAEKDALPSGAGAPDHESDAGRAAHGKAWTAWTLSILLLSVGAIALGAVGVVVWPEHVQLYFTYFFPHVSRHP